MLVDMSSCLECSQSKFNILQLNSPSPARQTPGSAFRYLNAEPGVNPVHCQVWPKIISKQNITQGENITKKETLFLEIARMLGRVPAIYLAIDIALGALIRLLAMGVNLE